MGYYVQKMYGEKYFTIDEANALLPQLRVLLKELNRMSQNLEGAGKAILPMLNKRGLNGGDVKAGHYMDALRRFYDTINAIAEMGCILKDIEMGLVDFLSIRKGKKVYLCWTPDEEKIGYWHDLDSGFMGRQPLFEK